MSTREPPPEVRRALEIVRDLINESQRGRWANWTGSTDEWRHHYEGPRAHRLCAYLHNQRFPVEGITKEIVWAVLVRTDSDTSIKFESSLRTEWPRVYALYAATHRYKFGQ